MRFAPYLSATKTLLLSVIHFLICGTAYSQSFNWVRQFGGPGNEHGHALAIDHSGNIILTGDMSDTCHFDSYTLIPQTVDMYIAKFDSSGNALWAKKITGPGFGDAFDVKTDSAGNIYVCGTFESTLTIGSSMLTSNGSFDAFIVKLDQGGNTLFALNIGGVAFDAASSIDVDDSGNCYTLGTFKQTVVIGSQALTSAGGSDVFVAKISPSGNILWAKSDGGTQEDYTGEIKQRQGELVIAGTFQNTASFSSTTITSSGAQDIFLAKYDTSGTLLWVHAYGGNSANGENLNSISIDDHRNIFGCGNYDAYTTLGSFNLTSAGGQDAFFTRLDQSGNVLWASHGGGIGFDAALDGALDAENNYYVTGQFTALATFGSHTLNSSGTLDGDIFILKCDSTGNLIGIEQAGGADGNDAGQAVAMAGRKIYLSGFFYWSAYFGTNLLPHVYDNDNIFLATLNADSLSGIADDGHSLKGIIIYPNPASEYFNIHLPDINYSQLEIFNSVGREIFSASLSGNDQKINTSTFPSGLYMIRISNRQNQFLLSKLSVIKSNR